MKPHKIIPEHQKFKNLDRWLSKVECTLIDLGYRKYKQNHKSEDFAYWKSFHDEKDKKLYQVGILFYDFRKYIERDPACNRIGIQYECMFSEEFDRMDLSVCKDISIEEFEKIAKTFYEALKQYT